MSFTFFPTWAVIAGALAIISLLFVLQWLRAQPKVIKIASMQLWLEASKNVAANKFWQRFRKWIAFLTAVLIALLLWFALSGVQTNDTSKAIQLYYLDTSVTMSIANNMEDAKSQLMGELSSAKTAKRELWIGNATPAVLLQQNTPNALLQAYLPTINASTHLSSFKRWLQTMSQRFADDQAIIVNYYGAAHFNDDATIPTNMIVNDAYLTPAIQKNQGITGLGQQLSIVDNTQSTRIIVTFTNSEGQKIDINDFSVRLNDTPLTSSLISALSENRYLITDIPLTNSTQTLTVELKTADKFDADNHASIVIPKLTQIKVTLQEGLPIWINHFIKANPALILDSTQADVSLCLNTDDTCPSAKATLYFDSLNNIATFHVSSSLTASVLKEFWQNNNWLSHTESQMPSLKILTSKKTYVQLPLHNLTQLIENEVPDPLLLLSHAIYWLADLSVVPPYVAVNEPLPYLQNSTLYEDNKIAGFPLLAGPFKTGADDALIATIQAPSTSSLVTQTSTINNINNTAPEPQFPWYSLCGLVALILLIVEWFMIQRRRWA